MERNLVTKRLLAEGWDKSQTPPGMRDWNEFYGGWEYDWKTLSAMTFETPCGLLVNGSRFGNGHMSYGGIEWTAENDCPTIACPRFLAEPCQLRHPALRRQLTETRNGAQQCCDCHRADRPYTYPGSVDQVLKRLEEESEELWRQFESQRGGRVCRWHSDFNRTTKTWFIRYDPIWCAALGGACQYCPILGKPLDDKKGNVFYDVLSSWTEPAQGLFPPEQKQMLKKGIKLLGKPVSLTICQAIVDYGLHNVRQKLELNWAGREFRDPSLKIEAVHFRAARQDTRDLLQDLRDAADGFQIIHAADELKAAKEQKKARRQASKEAKTRRIEKLIRQNGWESLDGRQKRQAEKLLDPEEIDQAIERRRAKKDQAQQLELF